MKTDERPRRRRGGREGSGSGLKWPLRVLAVGLLAFVLGYVITAVVFFPGSNRPPVVAVPDLREMDETSARRLLQEGALELELGDSFPNPRVPEGQILSQSPLPGQEVAPGSRVRVIVSSGAPEQAVPVVSSLTREQAVRLLEASGFSVEVVEVEDPRAAGRVVGVEPRPGTRVRMPAAVRLRVSSGPPLVAVPDVVGMSEAAAAEALEAVGLQVGEVERQYAGPGAEQVVLDQDPPPGDSIRQGERVRLRIATDRFPRTIIR